jgi:2-amino-4-hydroxy-6-hydroxymethyldihydropteridine diphosphokinase
MRDPVLATIGLGANLGDAPATVQAAIASIGALAQTQLLRASSLYRSAPVQSSGPDYVNAVVQVTTCLSAPALLRELQALEAAAGRERPFQNAPRTLDLDLLLYGDAHIDSASLTVPHSRMWQRAFVILPLAEIAPGLVSEEALQTVQGQRVSKMNGHLFNLLPPSLPGERLELATPVGKVNIYRSTPPRGAKKSAALPSLLLIHSVNAAGSAAEIEPLYKHYASEREVVAMELPGYGFSDRSDRAYTPRLMSDAVIAVIAYMRAAQGGAPVDVLALSLSCEYAARASVEVPDSVRRLAMVSPTGFSGRRRHYGPAAAGRGVAWLYRLLTRKVWVEGLYRTLTRPGVIRYFLARTWGSRCIDEALWRYCLLTTRQPGARYAPLHFLSGQLFSADVNTLYEALSCPVWVSMATRGDFTDYRGRETVQGRVNWQMHRISGGALPYFEDLAAFAAPLDPFWRQT